MAKMVGVTEGKQVEPAKPDFPRLLRSNPPTHSIALGLTVLSHDRHPAHGPDHAAVVFTAGDNRSVSCRAITLVRQTLQVTSLADP
jgi:hypothetical protein